MSMMKRLFSLVVAGLPIGIILSWIRIGVDPSNAPNSSGDEESRYGRIATVNTHDEPSTLTVYGAMALNSTPYLSIWETEWIS